MPIIFVGLLQFGPYGAVALEELKVFGREYVIPGSELWEHTQGEGSYAALGREERIPVFAPLDPGSSPGASTTDHVAFSIKSSVILRTEALPVSPEDFVRRNDIPSRIPYL